MSQDLITKSPLSKIPTLPLLLIVVLTVFVAYFLAWKFRNNYDPKHLIRWYGAYALVVAGLTKLLFLPVILTIGIWFAGAVVLVLRSNHYFYGQ